MPDFFVSAPGKVILFGEHSAVYGKPAIAAALSLRAYLLVQRSADPDEIVLEFPDIGLVHKWTTKDMPWDELAAAVPRKNGGPAATDELVPELLDLAADLLVDCKLELHYTACRCFLYLYFNLCGPNVRGHRFCIRLTLPIGAGLGSLASTAVCLAAALATLGGHVGRPVHGASDVVLRKELSDAELIDAWSFMGEKCFHGNPSGIDNAVATHGGAVLYQRMADPSTPLIRTSIRNFAALRLLLINTRVPRSTAHLVGNVASLVAKHAKSTAAILDAMSHVATDAYQLMMSPSPDRASLRELVDINHGLLVALGVSHPSLEEVRVITERHQLGATKLTGAGGGGCAITVVDDAVSESDLDSVSKELAAKGFETFQAMLGGKGVGMLSADDCADTSIFTAESLAAYESREHIEQRIGASAVPGWKFW
ncbi:mevalonate kinase [Metschnikowia bicuspidata var. bicuspidata NRRL YB-4993]|uniref:Mevalonate kinase n=1 Tax=Metschnikowia bicuspidata var. bicuspidata NRRL YB-4993 TaxID=869754 RepID=A0A1A0HA41_9ASCO|nr:mevalonate kinase [Metschnikowia bicuspidata var. bicuspidata NRRL YB-4993]OBA20870.1 mevalonate kinase [Metschnikowia bicuspidata var. bicuspidata NRRL YB-4993]